MVKGFSATCPSCGLIITVIRGSAVEWERAPGVSSGLDTWLTLSGQLAVGDESGVSKICSVGGLEGGGSERKIESFLVVFMVVGEGREVVFKIMQIRIPIITQVFK